MSTLGAALSAENVAFDNATENARRWATWQDLVVDPFCVQGGESIDVNVISGGNKRKQLKEDHSLHEHWIVKSRELLYLTLN